MIHVFEYNWAVYRRVWRGALTVTFIGPVLFLGSIGIGLGSLVGRGAGLGMPYLEFLGPALLAAACMQAAVGEATYPVMGKVKWNRTYEAVLASPIGVTGVVLGELAWYAFRQLLVAGAFFLVLLAFGVPRTPLALAAVPAGMLTGLAFALPIYAYSVTRESDAAFTVLFRWVIGPLFLFSGTFFPIDRLPVALQPVAWLLPLAHGVAITRDVTRGVVVPADLGHAAVLLAFVAAGTLAATVTLRRRMLP